MWPRFSAARREQTAYAAIGILLVLVGVLSAEVVNRLRQPLPRVLPPGEFYEQHLGKGDRLDWEERARNGIGGGPTFHERWSGVYWAGKDTPPSKNAPAGILEDLASPWPPLPDDTASQKPLDHLRRMTGARDVCALHGLRKVFVSHYRWRCQPKGG